jgi:hypothetical protein
MRKDVFLVNQALIKRDPRELFEPPKGDIIQKKGKVIIRIPIKKELLEDAERPFFGFLENYFIPKIDHEKMQDFWFYKNFYWAMKLRPNFYRYTLKEVKKVRRVKQHRIGLTYLLLYDLLSQKVPTVKDANQYLEEEGKSIDDRQRRLLRNEYYPDLFFRPIPELFSRKKDKRVDNFSSVLTNVPNFGFDYWQAVSLTMNYNQMFNEHLPPQHEFDKLDYLSNCIRLVTVDEIEDILSFGNELNEILDRVILRVGDIDEERGLMVKEMRKKTEIIEEFRTLLNTATYIRWFQIKTYKQRMEFLKKNRRLTYSKEEAEHIVPLLLQYYQDPELVSAYLYFGAKAFEAYKKPKYAKLLYNVRSKLVRTGL